MGGRHAKRPRHARHSSLIGWCITRVGMILRALWGLQAKLIIMEGKRNAKIRD